MNPLQAHLEHVAFSLEGSEQSAQEFVGAVARRVVKKWNPMMMEWDDLVGYGMAALLEVIDKRDENADSPMFYSYAYTRVHGAMVDAMRRWTMGRTRSRYDGDGHLLDRPVVRRMRPTSVEVAENHGEVPQSIPDPHKLVATKQIHEVLHRHLNRLHPIDRAIIVYHCFEGLPLCDVAQVFARSRSWASKRYRRALEALRKSLAREGIDSLPVA